VCCIDVVVFLSCRVLCCCGVVLVVSCVVLLWCVTSSSSFSQLRIVLDAALSKLAREPKLDWINGAIADLSDAESS